MILLSCKSQMSYEAGFKKAEKDDVKFTEESNYEVLSHLRTHLLQSLNDTIVSDEIIILENFGTTSFSYSGYIYSNSKITSFNIDKDLKLIFHDILKENFLNNPYTIESCVIKEFMNGNIKNLAQENDYSINIEKRLSILSYRKGKYSIELIRNPCIINSKREVKYGNSVD